jgi:predicted Zn-dependent protease
MTANFSSRRKSLFLLTLFSWILISVGCAVAPMVTSEGEQELGVKMAKEVERTMGLYDSPELVEYVKKLGRRLSEHSPRQDVIYAFHVVDMVEPNAFALPGGYVYVSRGLLALVNDEEELAGVLAHEIAHVASRHHAKSAGMSVITSPLRIGAGIAGAATGIVAPRIGGVIAGVGEVTSALFTAPYSREQEREADRVGQEIAAQAGYAPEGLSRFLKTLNRDEALHSGESRRYSFFATHPALRERVTSTAERAEGIRVARGKPIAKDRAGLLFKLEGLIVGDNPALGIFQDRRFLHPNLDFSFLFPSQWETLNTPQLVVGQAPNKDAIIVIQMVGWGEDPYPVVKALGKTMEIDLLEDSESTRINGLPAIRNKLALESSEGTMKLDMTWIAHLGRVYQITGVTSQKDFSVFQETFFETANTFRPLSYAERANIKVARLSVVKAREAETLEALIEQTGNVWSSAETAVANGIEENEALLEGQLIKVSIESSYGR